MRPSGSPLASGVDPALFAAVDDSSATFAAHLARARRVRSAAEVRTLAADCACAHPAGRRRTGAVLRSLGHFDLLSGRTAPVAGAVLWRSATRGRSRKTVVVLLIRAIVRRAAGPSAPLPGVRELLAYVRALEAVFAIDDVVDQPAFMSALAAADDPARALRDALAGNDDLRALARFVDSWEFADEGSRQAAWQLAAALEANAIASLVMLAGDAIHPSTDAVRVTLGVSGVLAQLVASLCLARVTSEPDRPDDPRAVALRDAAGIAVFLQSLDDLLDCAADGPVCRGGTGLNLFRCVLHESDPRALARLDALRRVDPVLIARTFPAAFTRYFTALGSIALTPAAARAAADGLALYELKDHL
jgi:hypothetical protein